MVTYNSYNDDLTNDWNVTQERLGIADEPKDVTRALRVTEIGERCRETEAEAMRKGAETERVDKVEEKTETIEAGSEREAMGGVGRKVAEVMNSEEMRGEMIGGFEAKIVEQTTGVKDTGHPERFAERQKKDLDSKALVALISGEPKAFDKPGFWMSESAMQENREAVEATEKRLREMSGEEFDAEAKRLIEHVETGVAANGIEKTYDSLKDKNESLVMIYRETWESLKDDPAWSKEAGEITEEEKQRLGQAGIEAFMKKYPTAVDYRRAQGEFFGHIEGDSANQKMIRDNKDKYLDAMEQLGAVLYGEQEKDLRAMEQLRRVAKKSAEKVKKAGERAEARETKTEETKTEEKAETEGAEAKAEEAEGVETNAEEAEEKEAEAKKAEGPKAAEVVEDEPETKEEEKVEVAKEKPKGVENGVKPEGQKTEVTDAEIRKVAERLNSESKTRQQMPARRRLFVMEERNAGKSQKTGSRVEVVHPEEEQEFLTKDVWDPKKKYGNGFWIGGKRFEAPTLGDVRVARLGVVASVTAKLFGRKQKLGVSSPYEVEGRKAMVIYGTEKNAKTGKLEGVLKTAIENIEDGKFYLLDRYKMLKSKVTQDERVDEGGIDWQATQEWLTPIEDKDLEAALEEIAKGATVKLNERYDARQIAFGLAQKELRR